MSRDYGDEAEYDEELDPNLRAERRELGTDSGLVLDQDPSKGLDDWTNMRRKKLPTERVQGTIKRK